MPWSSLRAQGGHESLEQAPVHLRPPFREERHRREARLPGLGGHGQALRRGLERGCRAGRRCLAPWRPRVQVPDRDHRVNLREPQRAEAFGDRQPRPGPRRRAFAPLVVTAGRAHGGRGRRHRDRPRPLSLEGVARLFPGLPSLPRAHARNLPGTDRSLDVAVDCWGWGPVDLSRIKERLARTPATPGWCPAPISNRRTRKETAPTSRL